ncbi:Fe-S cluster protein [Bacteroides sp. 214]|uniref:[Fe-Fe] hydrogenase large subunit C-terminal domain-containing protein n=1 Tax=Bacteroides sp. 214 TaxID=2302935 RepID=UPI0013D019C4|nr:[Fe-Fe] hydrogenase large subunit C-terminal domain-containing protein [Bacteroides sp. 214]NDW13750.1 Fe-S cluster protein [Bacteroides sp. 214]
MLRPVYTEPANCQDCYKCVRECPVKAIRIENNKANIIDERCVYCGHCTRVCPTKAKKIRDGLARARMTLFKHPKVYLSLAPSYIGEFPKVKYTTLVSAIKELGFAGVSETALGAEIVTDRTDSFLDNAPKNLYIGSACPVVVEYIRKYAPHYTQQITPIQSPMLAHAKMLKELYGEDTKVVFAGPCVAKKMEADRHPDLIDVAITFKELHRWFEDEGIDLEHEQWTSATEGFVPYHSKQGNLYPMENGMLMGMKQREHKVSGMAFSGLENIASVLRDIPEEAYHNSIFLELLSCEGGCINGPGKLSSLSPAIKRYRVVHQDEVERPHEFDCKHIDLGETFEKDPGIQPANYSEKQIMEALVRVGKKSREDELNCSSCGYDSCRDFATALIENRAEENMCASYMRQIAHDKATVLLQKIPAGVILVNSDLRIVDMNAQCADMLGTKIQGMYKALPGLSNVKLKSVVSLEPLFSNVLTTGKEIKERQVKEGDNLLIVSIFNIQPHHLVFGLLQNLQDPDVRKEWLIEKTREVMKNHLDTVQKVAGILGENAAFTDATLRAVIEAYDDSESL